MLAIIVVDVIIHTALVLLHPPLPWAYHSSSISSLQSLPTTHQPPKDLPTLQSGLAVPLFPTFHGSLVPLPSMPSASDWHLRLIMAMPLPNLLWHCFWWLWAMFLSCMDGSVQRSPSNSGWNNASPSALPGVVSRYSCLILGDLGQNPASRKLSLTPPPLPPGSFGAFSGPMELYATIPSANFFKLIFLVHHTVCEIFVP